MSRKRKQQLILEGVRVEKYASQGRSLAHIDGKVVFIEGAAPGDLVNVKLSKNKSDWAEGKAVAILEYSPERATPPCRHFGVCGGCKWQFLPYHKQLEYKQLEIEDTLKRLGKVVLPPLRNILGCDDAWQYRNKLEFTFSNRRYLLDSEMEAWRDRDPGPALGLHVPRLFDKVIDIEECYLMAEPMNAIRNGIRNFALEKGYSFYDIRQHTGWLRNLMIRLTTTGEIMVNLVVAHEDPNRSEMLDFISKTFPQITTLLYTINGKMNDSIFDLNPQVITGSGYITEKLEDFSFIIGPKSFFQTNTKQAEKLYSVTREFAELDGSQVLYDLYCGAGSIGIFCSRQVKKLIGVELIKEAVEDARENARINQTDKALFFDGDAAKICNPAFFEQHGRPDVVITDPPRAGMSEKLVETILDLEAPTVVYVSCNPATQARDLQLLDSKYQVTALQPVDMFPHTHHIENIAQLKLK
jgi:23S rRNA (uracil1939-C5)-methyltransferase